MFQNTDNIKNYDEILYTAINFDFCENIEDLILLLEKYDRRRDRQSVDLKRCVFTIIRDILRHPNVSPLFECSFVDEVKRNPPGKEGDIFNYLEKYWYEFDEIGRAYLLFFVRKNSLDR